MGRTGGRFWVAELGAEYGLTDEHGRSHPIPDERDGPVVYVELSAVSTLGRRCALPVEPLASRDHRAGGGVVRSTRRESETEAATPWLSEMAAWESPIPRRLVHPVPVRHSHSSVG